MLDQTKRCYLDLALRSRFLRQPRWNASSRVQDGHVARRKDARTAFAAMALDDEPD